MTSVEIIVVEGPNVGVATTTTGAPSIRKNFSAVWTGSKMLVWGGVNSNDGGQYDMQLDSWSALPTTGAPAGRTFPTAIWTGTKMFVFGGYSATGAAKVNTGGYFDVETNSWALTTTQSAPSIRQDHTAVWTGSKMIIWGGRDTSSINTGAIFTP